MKIHGTKIGSFIALAVLLTALYQLLPVTMSEPSFVSEVQYQDRMGWDDTRSDSNETYDVWLVEDEVGPDHFLFGGDLDLWTNIHYNLPPLLESIDIHINFSLVDENGVHIHTLFQDNVTISDLGRKSKGIKTYWSPTVPGEEFLEYIEIYDHRPMRGMNYIMVKLTDKNGFPNESEFQYNNTPDKVIKQLYAIRDQGGGIHVQNKTQGTRPDFIYAKAILLIIILLLGVQIYRWFVGNGEKFSGLLAIIIMLSLITATHYGLWIWHSKREHVPEEISAYKIDGEFIERGRSNDFVFLITDVECGHIESACGLNFEVLDSEMNDISNGHRHVRPIYGKPINERFFLSFRDGDHDGRLTIGDRLIIKSVEHVNDDGTPSPGLVKERDIFRIIDHSIIVIEAEVSG